MINIVPEANFGIEICKHGTKERNAVFLAAETDYMLWFQTDRLPYPKQLFNHILNGSNAAMIRE
jgi:hypothetical protein